ncbi:MAG: F0F1 ATP synthase subunit B [Candidatus Glassbacteria bacterium]
MLITINPGLVIWTIITFVILFFILKKFAWVPILDALEKREKTIKDNLIQAQKTREEAENLLSEYNKKLDSIKEEARKLVDEGKAMGEMAREELLEQARREYEEQLQRAKKEIELAKQKAMDEFQGYAVDLTLDMASRVTERSLTDEDHERLAREALEKAAKLK